jgi:hypothetical protein
MTPAEGRAQAAQDRPGPILAIDPRRKTNAQLIADVARLGYLPEPVIDVTYGYGNFWADYQPAQLTTNDLHQPAQHAYSYLRPEQWPEDWIRAFSTAVFDPPYKLNGTPTDDDRYGADQQMSVAQRLRELRVGAVATARLVRPHGVLLVKCQAQVASGVVHWQPDLVLDAVKADGWGRVDEMHLLNTVRPQRSQVHARRNYSTLLVLKRR